MIKLSLAALIATTSLLAAGCGSGSHSMSTPLATSATAPTGSSAASSTPAPPGAGKVSLGADPSGALKFTTKSLSAKAGKITIVFSNPAPLAHNLTIATSSGTVLGATPTFQGGSKTLSLKLKPGSYTFFCSVPGHRDGGMQGTLTVK